MKTSGALILSLLMVCPAQAQEERSPHGFTLGQLDRDYRTIAADTPAQITLMKTAQCVADDRPLLVKRYLASLPASQEEDDALAEFGDKIRRCMPDMDMSSVGNMRSARGTMTMSYEHGAMRGALAEAFLTEERIQVLFDRFPDGDEGMYIAETFHGERSSDTARAFALGFAGCVLGHNKFALPELFETAPGSAEESKAIRAMAPTFSNCVMEGQRLALSAPVLRGQIAEVVYYAQFAEEGE